jgi:glycosyltransferase involved in cell wall biosynthesis
MMVTMSAMRVALVHNFHASTVPSGEDAVVLAEAAALERAGVDVRIIGTSNDAITPGPVGAIRAAATIATGFGISPLRELSRFRPDIVHVHGLFPYLDRRWLRRIDVPIVATSHNYRAVCANGYLFRDGQVCTRCLDGHPWSGVRFGCYRDSRLASLPHAVGRAGGMAHDPILSCARKVLALSDRAKSVLVRAGVSEDRLMLDHHFLPEDLDAGLAADCDDTWVFVGRLSPEKGIDKLVAQWPASEALRVIGNGDLRSVLERAAAGKQIQFMGNMARSAVMAWVRTSFGLVFPSRWYETFGLVYIEGLAAGLPTIAFQPNVVADAVAKEGTGLVGSWDALDDSLAEARARFDGLRSHCRRIFEERYTEKAFLERRLSLYTGLLS